MFTNAFSDAVRATLPLPIAVIVAVALAAFFARAGRLGTAEEPVAEEATTAA